MTRNTDTRGNQKNCLSGGKGGRARALHPPAPGSAAGSSAPRGGRVGGSGRVVGGWRPRAGGGRVEQAAGLGQPPRGRARTSGGGSRGSVGLQRWRSGGRKGLDGAPRAAALAGIVDENVQRTSAMRPQCVHDGAQKACQHGLMPSWARPRCVHDASSGAGGGGAHQGGADATRERTKTYTGALPGGRTGPGR